MRLRSTEKIYYGWYITVVLAITETVSYGVLFYALQVFLTSIETDLGWTRSQVTLGGSLSLLVTAFMAYPVGWWVDKYGARLMMTIASIGATLLVIAWSQVTNLWVFYAIWFGIGMCGSMLFYEPAFAVIAVWFKRRRSLALTVVTVTAGFASTIFHPLSDFLLQQVGWRQAVLILGIILGVINIPLHAFVLRRRPSDMGIQPDGDEKSKVDDAPPSDLSLSDALRSRFFWLMTIAFLLASFSIYGLRFHFIPYLEEIGVSATTAAFASGSIGIMQVMGRLIFVPLDAHISGRRMVTGFFAMQAIAIVILITSSAYLAILAFVALFGASLGMQTLVRPAILADTFGSTNYGRISSVMAIPLTLAITIAPVTAGLMYDYFGDYDLLLIITLALSVLASVVMIFAKPDISRSAT